MRRYFNNKGSSIVVVTISMVLILGVTALVTDIGLTIYEKEKLANAIDAATLAAMQDIDKSDQTIINTAKNYAQLNGLDPSTLNISINPDRKGITIKSQKQVNYYFARIVGINEGQVDASSKAKVAPITSYKGVRPLAIANQVLEFNKQYTLKEDSGDGLSGNYGVLALGGNGASVYRDNLYYGYKNNLKVGDIVFTETGNITQATNQGVQYLIGKDPSSTYYSVSDSSQRLIVIPVVNTLDLNGKKPIVVVGFAAFFLEGLTGSGGNTDIVGRFIKHVGAGDFGESQSDYGLKAVKLIN